MVINPTHTPAVLPEQISLTDLISQNVSGIPDNSILVITSKIVSLCEGRVVPIDSADKEELIKKESDYYLPSENHKYQYHFSMLNNTLISAAGIDKSNGSGNYVLWPSDPQATANAVRPYLIKRYGLSKVGVIITDSMSRMLRRGSTGTCLAHSGFLALKDYRHTKDLFGYELKSSVANLAEGLAAAAVVTMGEGIEQTPLAVISDVPFIDFQDRDPTSDELNLLHLTLEDDFFEVFLNSVPWQKGQRGTP